MTLPHGYKTIDGTQHSRPAGHQVLQPTAGDQEVTVTVMLRRRRDAKPREFKDFSADARAHRVRPPRADIEQANGADPQELKQVEAFAKLHGLTVVQSHQARRSVVLSGSASAINKAFGVELHDIQSPHGKYHGHSEAISLPSELANYVEAVVGLTNRQVPAKHFSTAARRRNKKDPPQTKPLTPQQ